MTHLFGLVYDGINIFRKAEDKNRGVSKRILQRPESSWLHKIPIDNLKYTTLFTAKGLARYLATIFPLHLLLVNRSPNLNVIAFNPNDPKDRELIAYLDQHIAIVKKPQMEKRAQNLSRREVHVPDENEYSDLSQYDYTPVDIVVQKHDAKKRGTHYDLRIVTPDRAISFVLPRNQSWSDLSAKPGEKGTWIRMPDHAREYAYWTGEIPEGEYGAGKVEKAYSANGVLNYNKNGDLILTILDGDKKRKFMLANRGDNKYFAISRNLPQDHYWRKRQTFKTYPEDQAPGEESEMMASEKLDGALVYAKLTDKGVTLTSRRKSTDGSLIEKEHHVPWIRDIDVPKKYQGLVLAAEMVHPRGFSFVSPILNSKPENAIAKQEKAGRIRLMPHNILNKDMTYKEKINLMRQLVNDLDNPYISLPEYSNNPQQLYRKMKDRGGEGVIIFNPNEKDPTMYKHKIWDTYTGKIVGAEPGKGKLQGALGAFIVEDKDGNKVRVGIGKGFTHEKRREMMQKFEDKYKGRKARILSHGSTGTTLRQPAFGGWDLEDRPLDSFRHGETTYSRFMQRMNQDLNL